MSPGKLETLNSVKSIDGITDKNGDTPLHNVVKMWRKTRRYDPLPILLGKASDVNPVNVQLVARHFFRRCVMVILAMSKN